MDFCCVCVAEILVNECETGLDNCHSNADCTDTEDAFYCTCQAGYTGDGVTCEGKHYFTLVRVFVPRNVFLLTTRCIVTACQLESNFCNASALENRDIST